MSVSVLTSVGNILPQLHRTDSSLTGSSSNAAISADLVWFTKKELIRFFDEALKRLAKRALVFVTRDTSITLVAATASYALPGRPLAVLHVAHKNKGITATSTHEIEARDTNFSTIAGTPQRWYVDKLGVNRLGLHPVPTSSDVGSAALEVIQSEYPAEVDENESNTTMPIPMVVADWAEARVVSEGYKKESDIRCAEISSQIDQFAFMVESALINYYGSNQ